MRLVVRAFACLWLATRAGLPATATETGEVCRYCGRTHHVSGFPPPALKSPSDRQYAPDRQVDVTQVLLDVTPDFAQRSIVGKAKLTFKPLSKPLEQLQLDAANLNVGAVRASQPVRNYAADQRQLSIVFDKPIPPGVESWVEIDYSATPQMGLYFRTAATGLSDEEAHCWTQGEPHEARHWFPCFDWPNERAASEIICRVPRDMTVVANGRFVGEESAAGSPLKAFHYREDQSHPAYLICFVAGKFVRVEGRHGRVPLAFYTQPSKAKYAQSAFAETAEMMAFLEQEIGLPYPWEKYDQATIADFMWGGMENTTLTTLAHRALAEPASENIREARSLIVHEMTHQWFGDYVTCKDWSHLWLNEGFATYYEHLYDGHKFGRDTLLYGMHRDDIEDILPALADKRPIAYRRYQHPEEQFDFRAYPKGSWVLHMLRSQVGEELYRQSIGAYLRRHALGEVTSEDLREAFEQTTGKTLDRFFDQWVYHGGLPELKVTYEWLAKEKQARVVVEQTQATGDDVLLFHIPTKLRFAVAGKLFDEAIEIDGRRSEFFVTLPGQPQIVRFDPEFTVLAKIDMELSDELLAAQLTQRDDAMGRVLACDGLARRRTDAAIAALKNALQSDPFFGVREAAAEALAKVGTTAAAEALGESLAQPDARVRFKVVESLGKCVCEPARKRLLKVYAEEPNPGVAAAAVTGLARFGGEETRAVFRAALASKSLRNERAAAAFTAAGELNDPALTDELIAALRNRQVDVPPRDLSAGMSSLAKSSQRGRRRDAAFAMLSSLLDNPREPLRTGAMTALGELGDPRARALLDSFARSLGNERQASIADEALAVLDKTAPEVPAEIGALRGELRELREDHSKLEKKLDEFKAKSKNELPK